MLSLTLLLINNNNNNNVSIDHTFKSISHKIKIKLIMIDVPQFQTFTYEDIPLAPRLLPKIDRDKG